MKIVIEKEIDFAELITLDTIKDLISDMIMEKSEWDIENELQENDNLYEEVMAKAIEYVKNNL